MMFRDKNFLIEQGLYAGCREDTFYIIGEIYDEVIESKKFNFERIEQLREYLDKNREVINNATYSISLTESIVSRFKRVFITGTENTNNKNKEEKKVVKEEDIEEKNNYRDTYNISELLENNAIRKINTGWEDKKGVYGIYIEGTLVYVGSTFDSFKHRFITHKQAIKGEPTQYIHKKVKEALNNNKSIEFKPLVVIDDLQMLHKRSINAKELKCMELAIITAAQPKYNIAGRLQPFNFD